MIKKTMIFIKIKNCKSPKYYNLYLTIDTHYITTYFLGAP